MAIRSRRVGVRFGWVRLTGGASARTCPMPDHDFLTTTQAAVLLGVSRQSIDRWIRDGKLRARRIQVGKRAVYRIKRSDFSEFVRRYVSGDW